MKTLISLRASTLPFLHLVFSLKKNITSMQDRAVNCENELQHQ